MDVIKTGLLFILLLVSTVFTSLNAQCTPFIVSHKRVIVQVKVNGQGPYPFLLDTGSTITILDKSIAKDLPGKGQVQLTGIGERAVVDSRIANISVGTFSDAELPVLVYDLKKTEASEDVKTLGILGNDVLMDAGGFSLDYKTGCIEVPQY
jgi:predicted aspartyl protease